LDDYKFKWDFRHDNIDEFKATYSSVRPTLFDPRTAPGKAATYMVHEKYKQAWGLSCRGTLTMEVKVLSPGTNREPSWVANAENTFNTV